MAEHHKDIPTRNFQKNAALSDQTSRSTALPLPEIPQGRHTSTTGSTGSGSKDMMQKEENDYQSLDRGQVPYLPIDWSAGSPSISLLVPSDYGSFCSPTSQTSISAATSPAKDARPAPLPPGKIKPEICGPLQPPLYPNPKSAENADEIVELNSKARGDQVTEEKQIKTETEKEEEAEPPVIPSTNFAIACMVTFCFNLPLGILAVYFSLRALRAFQEGRTKEGEKRSRWSIFISLLGIAFTTILVSSLVLYIAMKGQKRINQNKAYTVRGGISL